MATGDLIELEALVRWMHPERGLVGPADLLSRKRGRLLPVGEAARKACRQMAAWLQEFNVGPAVRVSVNLSCRQFRQTHLSCLLASWKRWVYA